MIYEKNNPVAYVTGYNNGYCVVQPTNSAAVLSTGLALYTHPPAADVAELVEAFSYVIRDLEMRSHLKRGDEKGVVDIGHGAYEKAKAALAKWEGKE
jgi:hypothetical protein